MDTRSKHIKSDCLRKTIKPGSKLRWKRHRVFTEGNEALENCRASALKAIRKCLPREQRRSQLARLAKALGHIGKKETAESAYVESPAAACIRSQPSGAMAPENTTQYLMANAYEDMTTCEDSEHESGLDFERRDFEEAFALHWQPE